MTHHFKDHNKRETDARFEFIASTLGDIRDRMEQSHTENKEWKESHYRIDHKEISSWREDHIGQKDDTPHALIEKRLAAHSKRFWWLSGAGATAGAVISYFMDLFKRP